MTPRKLQNLLHFIKLYAYKRKKNTIKKTIIPRCQDTTQNKMKIIQCAKRVVSNSPGLVDFAIGLVNSVFNSPDGQVTFFEKFE